MYTNLFKPELWYNDESLLKNIKKFAYEICKCEDPLEYFRLGTTDEITVEICGSKPISLLSGEMKDLKEIVRLSSMKRESLVVTWADNLVRILFELYINCAKVVFQH
jgi:hypothetical protein